MPKKGHVFVTEEMWWTKSIPVESGCREWQRSLYTCGYGQTHWKGRNYYAHRLAWIFSRGSIPEGMQVCHTCDNRLCVNVDHLWLGTVRDNALDRQRKGRGKNVGSQNTQAKLDEEQVKEIKQLLNKNWSLNELAKLYKVSTACIWLIRTNQKWTHVKA